MRVKETPPSTPTPSPPRPSPLVIEAAGQRYVQTAEFRYLGGLVNEQGDLNRDINYRCKIAWVCLTRYARELFDRPGPPIWLKTRLLERRRLTVESANSELICC